MQNYEVKMSKKMVIMACISAGILELLFLGLSVYFICDHVLQENITFDEKAAFYTSVCCGMVFALILAVVFIYILHTYINQVDIYCENKVIRKKGNKVIFELKYDNIKAIRQGYGMRGNFFLLAFRVGVVCPMTFAKLSAAKVMGKIELLCDMREIYEL